MHEGGKTYLVRCHKLTHAAPDLLVQAAQAQRLIELLGREQPKRALVEMLLPVMANAKEACKS